MKRLINLTLSNREKWLFTFVLTLIFSSIIIKKYQDINLIENDSYTIGIIIRKTYSKASDMEYLYYYKGQKFKTTGYSGDKKKRKVGGRYFVIFNQKWAKNSELFVQLPVPDSIKKVPYGGWDKLPIPEYQKYVDDYFEKSNNNWFMRFIPPW
ncbi:MAG: hypothetical protein RQ735_08260 [Flavobacteriaceae bacterium]|nr:hypothetical protein [Flavobacteriaceae bacterium]